MDKNYQEFHALLDNILRDTVSKNIIIYGCGRGGDFIKWFYGKYYHKDIKFMMDRWADSPNDIILHLWALYYTYEEDDLIINTTHFEIPSEFNDTGENWENVAYQEKNILNLWKLVYGEKDSVIEREISYFDWLEYKMEIDLLQTIRRKHTFGKDSHGYFPTDFRFFIDGFEKYGIDCKKDAVLDIGCGKGSGVFALKAAGFEHIGAVEYTENIFNTMLENLNKAGYKTEIAKISDLDANLADNGISCYQGDASFMKKQLDLYNWFFLFNPFSLDVAKAVIDNILESLHRVQRKVHIFYAEPIAHNYILSTDKFTVMDCIKGRYGGVSYYSIVYESK